VFAEILPAATVEPDGAGLSSDVAEDVAGDALEAGTEVGFEADPPEQAATMSNAPRAARPALRGRRVGFEGMEIPFGETLAGDYATRFAPPAGD
jgi:hypothetical protein